METINNFQAKLPTYNTFPLSQSNYQSSLFGQNVYPQVPLSYDNSYNQQQQQQYQPQNSSFLKHEFLARDVYIQGLNLSQDNLYSAMVVLIPNRPTQQNNEYQSRQMLNDSLFQQYVVQQCVKNQKLFQQGTNNYNTNSNININNNYNNNTSYGNQYQNQTKQQTQQQLQQLNQNLFNQMQVQQIAINNTSNNIKVSGTQEKKCNKQSKKAKNDAAVQQNKVQIIEKQQKKQIKVKQEDGHQTETIEEIYEINDFSQSSTTKTIINNALSNQQQQQNQSLNCSINKDINESNSNLQLIQSQQLNEEKCIAKQESSNDQIIAESFETDCTNETQSVNINNNNLLQNNLNNINNSNNMNQFGSFMNNIQNLQEQYQNILGNNGGNINMNHIDILQQIGLEEHPEDLNGLQSGKKRKSKFDTKNLVKNFLNSFFSFVQSQEEESFIIQQMGYENNEPVTQIRNLLKDFFRGKKFNRDLLKEFMFESIFRPHFLLYLEKRAPEWIEKGRMKDKASHWRALKNYTFVCTNYEKIKSWRFRYNFV